MMQHHKSLCFHNFTQPIFCKAPFLFHTMNYLLSGNKTCTSPQQGKQKDNTGCKKINRFRALRWSSRFRVFLEFKKEHGHTGMFLPDGISFALLDCFQLTYACYSAVPHRYQPNMQLSRWVKRQRYQYKLRKAGRPHTMTDARIEALQKAGFIWDSHSNVWVGRHNDLRAFEKENGHCNVAFNEHAGSGQHNALARWVKHQRSQYKLLLLGKPTNMTPERKNKLDHLGFQWRIKDGKLL
jgi:hypothetical protein